MSIIYGFARFRIKNDKVQLNPFIPKKWDSYSFKILFRDNLLSITVNKENIKITLEKGNSLDILVHGKNYNISNIKPLII